MSLRTVPSREFRENSGLPKQLLHDKISTPNNVFLSDIGGPSPVVKAEDLGIVLMEGDNNTFVSNPGTRGVAKLGLLLASMFLMYGQLVLQLVSLPPP
ncbi:hypothetical protein AJ78_01017 [Emergomyces pasteurianus Ep9510]|uniref:Uncharacterized protein n=1 Tax=Emergomyces pasteurianus Ep9510 TaxID=1447872 RepID=A0A1J9QUP4_9EURO|nr:hypothetical protein AJ78_01017 [Emergomyces pasteurianus Ep9510]